MDIEPGTLATVAGALLSGGGLVKVIDWMRSRDNNGTRVRLNLIEAETAGMAGLLKLVDDIREGQKASEVAARECERRYLHIVEAQAQTQARLIALEGALAFSEERVRELEQTVHELESRQTRLTPIPPEANGATQ